MKKSMILIAVSALILSSCGSKKELVACQETNKSLTESLQAAKEDLDKVLEKYGYDLY